MPPSANSDGGWREKLATLRARLDELDAASEASQWEQLDQLAPRIDRAMRELFAHPASPSPADAELLRQTLTLATTLQTRAAARRSQIQPLLEAWRSTGRTDQEA